MTELQQEQVEMLVQAFGTGRPVTVLSASAAAPVEFTCAGSPVTITRNTLPDGDAGEPGHTVILTGEWEEKDLLSCFGCRTRKQLYALLNGTIGGDGQLLLVADNPLYVRDPKLIRRMLAGFLNRKSAGQTFAHRHAAELRDAGFGKTERFMIYPHACSMRHLVSPRRKAYLDFMSLIYRQTPHIPLNPRKLAVWMVISSGLGRSLFPAQLIWARG